MRGPAIAGPRFFWCNHLIQPIFYVMQSVDSGVFFLFTFKQFFSIQGRTNTPRLEPVIFSKGTKGPECN